jgi:hypothetical protein
MNHVVRDLLNALARAEEHGVMKDLAVCHPNVIRFSKCES